LKLRCLVLAGCLLLAAVAMPAAEPAPADTLETRWGPLPPPTAQNTAVPTPADTPLWKHLVRVPYHVGSVPVNAADWMLRSTVVELERLGVFRPATTLVKGIRGPLDTFWLPTGSLGEQRGLEYGLIVQRPLVFDDVWVLKGTATYSTRRSSAVTLGLRSRYGEPEWFEVGGGSVRDGKREFFGTGWDSDEDDDGVYRRHLDWVGAAWRRQWSDRLEATVAGHQSAVRARHSRFDRDEAVDLVFAEQLPYGYGLTSSGFTGSLKLAYDSTERSGNPTGGTRLHLQGERFWNTDDTEVAHWTWVASAEHYLELGLPQRTLAIKAWWLQQDNLGDDPTPFTRLLTNRDPYKLRGFGTQRFHAAGFTGLTVEYRWPFWILNQPGGAGVDAYVFGDAGQPFDQADEVAAARLLYSGGMGLRAIGRDGGFAVRLEVAVGREGTHLRLSAKQLFQFIKAGFYDGSEPLPLLR
jgi:hypothetical protein